MRAAGLVDQELPNKQQTGVPKTEHGERPEMEDQAVQLLASFVDGAAYRFFFATRAAWNGTAHRSADGAVSIVWTGETSAQSRRFALVADSGGVVVPDKPNWTANTTSATEASGRAKPVPLPVASCGMSTSRHESNSSMRSIAAPSRAREIVLGASACVVTDDEHQRLTAVSQDLQGWDRYIAPRVDVYDEQTGKPFIANGALADEIS